MDMEGNGGKNEGKNGGGYCRSGRGAGGGE